MEQLKVIVLAFEFKLFWVFTTFVEYPHPDYKLFTTKRKRKIQDKAELNLWIKVYKFHIILYACWESQMNEELKWLIYEKVVRP